ncbi:diguanylate cyclase [Amphritea sp. 1_MG-2023]|uniref:sensor domain-containing diguanylate cyclase n=1 Tax=Amphritea sp. 1_MG-2023 TaxID=3062670 RepID=UPI0026E29F1E|nr:diguanylate cyclase [Amphritea sp. 1_MG-2023]MDO6563895.1 diguanylate cyclase [Amphritea sp. 1_MG-2023]
MNATANQDINDIHWILGLLQNFEAGLIVIDRDNTICLWNDFMENHSGIAASKATNQKLFSLFPELPEHWLTKKMQGVLLLNNTAYISWEQKPYLFQFKSHRPITGSAPYMYQNVTLIPLSSPTGQVDHIGMLIYDVTDNAVAQQALQAANKRLQSLSRVDGLTGLYNRAYWQECLKKEFARFGRLQAASSLIILDIDHFKRVNDTYGHQAGDIVIQTIANILQQQARKTDFVGRYGGEEYGAILVGTHGANAMIFAERLRSAVEASVIDYGDHQLSVTISIGLSEIRLDQSTETQWLEEADQALYKSKQNGRNQVTLFQRDQ